MANKSLEIENKNIEKQIEEWNWRYLEAEARWSPKYSLWVDSESWETQRRAWEIIKKNIRLKEREKAFKLSIYTNGHQTEGKGIRVWKMKWKEEINGKKRQIDKGMSKQM